MVKRIILSADFTHEKPGDPDDTNTDVIVEMDNGDKYVAFFASTLHLKKVLHEAEAANQGVSRNFYRMLNLVLIRDFNDSDLWAVIETMLAEGDFQLAFRKL